MDDEAQKLTLGKKGLFLMHIVSLDASHPDLDTLGPNEWSQGMIKATEMKKMVKDVKGLFCTQ